MSFKDRCWYTLRCAKCGSGETLPVSDQGVCWTGADWDAGATFLRFDTAWTGGGQLEPELARATCQSCGDAAQVVQRYPL
jgi:hypothetical protein